MTHHVLLRATNGARAGGIFLRLVVQAIAKVLGQAKVGEAHVPVRTQQYVLRLEVPVEDAEAVQVIERENNLGCGLGEGRLRRTDSPRTTSL